MLGAAVSSNLLDLASIIELSAERVELFVLRQHLLSKRKNSIYQLLSFFLGSGGHAHKW